jgi:hypothetical protein
MSTPDLHVFRKESRTEACSATRPRAAGFALPASSTSCPFVPLCCWRLPWPLAGRIHGRAVAAACGVGEDRDAAQDRHFAAHPEDRDADVVIFRGTMRTLSWFAAYRDDMPGGFGPKRGEVQQARKRPDNEFSRHRRVGRVVRVSRTPTVSSCTCIGLDGWSPMVALPVLVV